MVRHIFLFKYLALVFAVIVIFSSCSDTKDTSHVFSKRDRAGILEIVAYYDSIVSQAEPDITNIDQAYRVYLDSVCPLIRKSGDMSLAGIDIQARRKLFDRIDRHALGQIFIVGDTLKYFSLTEKKRVERYFPYYVKINRKGDYMKLLGKLSKNNELIENYTRELREFGDLTPACYGMILRNCDQLDFSDPMQRLVFVVTVLHTNETVKDMFRH